MAELTRMGLALTLSAVVSGCGLLTRAPTVPEPITPVQKATASPDNPDSAILADFNARLEKYVTQQRALAKQSPALEETKEPADITVAQETLAAKIRAARKHAKQGDIFTPQIAAMFRRLLAPELKGEEGRETKANVQDEWATVSLRVNSKYPASQPLPTVPPNLLANLPPLPEDVEYRIVEGRHLILRDVDANIIVDYIPNAIR